MTRQSLPRHIGFIPNGNRRWAAQRNQPREAGYAQGIAPGPALFECCRRLGIEEVSVYGFTQDNTRRPIYVVDSLWPDFHSDHLDAALSWFRLQDRTLGG